MTPNVMLDSKEVVDVVSVYKCAVDARDAMAIKAEMLEDGTDILVSQPSVPSFLIKDVNQMHELETRASPNPSCGTTLSWPMPLTKVGASNPTSGI